MNPLPLRPLKSSEYFAAAEVVCASVREWYAAHGKPGRFPGGPKSAMLFPEVYEAMDPGCCIVAEDSSAGRFAGVCFYHPRELHVSLGILAVHPDYFGRGIAKQLVRFVCDVADEQKKPLRLVSSAGNLDSFSLYTRHGFVPRAVYHTMNLVVAGEGLKVEQHRRVREARAGDAARMAELEFEVSGIRRQKDFEYFVANQLGAWHVSVMEEAGEMKGFLVSVRHPGSEMLGPGVMRDEETAAGLISYQLDRHHRGGSPTFLVPAEAAGVVKQMYALGAKNTEVHVCQVRGEFQAFRGVSMPTFMPETG
jgi:GNAT superfamily N-acetyltransferase